MLKLATSSGCNQRCNLCYVDYLNHKGGFLEEEIMLSLMQEFSELGVKSVLLAGEGEPTLNNGIIKAVEAAYRNKIDIALNSIATLLDEKYLLKILPCLMWARFTIQAANHAKYSLIHRSNRSDLDRAIKNIALAVKIKRDMSLSVTLGIQQILINENKDDIYETAKLAKDLGVDYYVVKRFSKHPNNEYDVPEDLYKEKYETLKRVESLGNDSFKAIVRWNNFEKDSVRTYKSCLGIPFITQILANGKIYPCSRFFRDEEYCYGDLHENSFKDIILSSRAEKINKKIRDEVNVDKCMSFCRHHSTNNFLWEIENQPLHQNFI